MPPTLTNSPPGQNFDRFDHSKGESSMRKMLAAEEDLISGPELADITPFQKMLSATTGSLLTGLTSMPPTFLTPSSTGRLED